MAKEHSRVKKRRRGCLSGCLVNILLVLGAAALLFVAACSFGIIKNDPQTGAPYVTFEEFGLGRLDQIDLSALSSLGVLEDMNLPDWPYALERTGLTVKTLRAGGGEALLVCSDGYTMLLGAGEGKGLLLCGQLLLSGVNRLDAAVALQSADAQIGGMGMAIRLMKPAYLLYPDTQVKTQAYNGMMDAAAQVQGLTPIAAKQGLAFSLGRAQVQVIGPAARHHTDERDDGLSVRIDYGNTSVLVMGGITQSGEGEILSSAPVDADVLIASCGGSGEGTSTAFAERVTPKIALLTGENPANAVRVRLERVGAQVYTAKEHGVMTVYSDGENVRIVP